MSDNNVKKIGLNVGYFNTKVQGYQATAIFPSVVGAETKSRFSLGAVDTIHLEQPYNASVGEEALEQSRFLTRREDPNWIKSDEWMTLALAGITEVTKASKAQISIVLGLPVSYYTDENKGYLTDRLTAEPITVKRKERSAQTFEFIPHVVPEPFGTVADLAMNWNGRITNLEVATGNVAVVDIGGKTTNLENIKRMREVGTKAKSVDLGMWDATRSLESYLDENYPGHELNGFEVAEILKTGTFKYYGEPVDLSEVVNEIREEFGKAIVAEITQLWGTTASIDKIIVSGGGAGFLGEYLKQRYTHATIAEDSIMANARGFYKLAQFWAS